MHENLKSLCLNICGFGPGCLRPTGAGGGVESLMLVWSFWTGGDRYLESCLTEWGVEGKRFWVRWWGSIILSFQGHQANFCKPYPHACMFACVRARVPACVCVCVRERARKRGPWPLRALCEETTAVHSQQLIGPYLAVPFIFIFYQLLSIICVLSWVWDLILFG